jgi:hypothetical protein
MAGSKTIAVGVTSGVVLSVMMVSAFLLDMLIVQSTSGPPMLTTDNMGSELLRARGSTVWLVEGWLYTLRVIPGYLFVLNVYGALRDGDSDMAGAGLVGSLLFWIFHTLHNVALLTVLQVLVPQYASGTSQETSIEVLATGLLGFANLLFGFGTSIGGLFSGGIPRRQRIGDIQEQASVHEVDRIPRDCCRGGSIAFLPAIRGGSAHVHWHSGLGPSHRVGRRCHRYVPAK